MLSLSFSALTDYSLINVIGNAVIGFDCLIDFIFAEIFIVANIKMAIKLKYVKIVLV